MSGRDATWGNIYGSCDFLGFLIFFILQQSTAHTREPIFAPNSSQDAVWCKEDPFRDEKCVNSEIRGSFTLKTPPEWSEIGTETVRDTRNMSMNHDYETGVALIG